jgi:hypothetical protein
MVSMKLPMLILALSFSASPGWAKEHAFAVTTDITWASKYMADGFKIGGDHPVFQPSINLATPLDGASLMLWSSIQMERENQQFDEYDLMARYERDLFTGEQYAIHLQGYYDYWMYPKETTADGSVHGNKLNAGISAPSLFPIAGSHLVPSYNVYYWLYWAQNRSDLYQGGTHHEVMLEYYHDIPRLIPGAREQWVGVTGSVNYNDGAFGVHPGWSHSTAQLVVGVYALECSFSLSLNRQWSYEPSIDPTDEFWSTLSLQKEF